MQMQVLRPYDNVEDDYGESDGEIGSSDDGDDDEQGWIDCILIFFLRSILACKWDILHLPF